MYQTFRPDRAEIGAEAVLQVGGAFGARDVDQRVPATGAIRDHRPEAMARPGGAEGCLAGGASGKRYRMGHGAD
ncbi:MAG: hypothetical protein PF443_05450 [Allgaiera sp.]|nr:hypothetical protein [Allgaiera sp.]